MGSLIGRVRVVLIVGLLATAGVLFVPSQAKAAAWTFSYYYRGRTYTYPTRYASKQEAINAYYAWKRDRYSYDRRPPQFSRTNYRPNDRPDRNRYPY